jgi:hypothetical protein
MDNVTDLINWAIDLLLTSPEAYKQEETNVVDGQDRDSRTQYDSIRGSASIVSLVQNNPLGSTNDTKANEAARKQEPNDDDNDQPHIGSIKPARKRTRTLFSNRD